MHTDPIIPPGRYRHGMGLYPFHGIPEQKGGIIVRFSTIVKGVSIGAAAGTACYLISRTPDRKKHAMKRHAEKALKAAGSLMEDITSIMD